MALKNLPRFDLPSLTEPHSSLGQRPSPTYFYIFRRRFPSMSSERVPGGKFDLSPLVSCASGFCSTYCYGVGRWSVTLELISVTFRSLLTYCYVRAYLIFVKIPRLYHGDNILSKLIHVSPSFASRMRHLFYTLGWTSQGLFGSWRKTSIK